MKPYRLPRCRILAVRMRSGAGRRCRGCGAVPAAAGPERPRQQDSAFPPPPGQAAVRRRRADPAFPPAPCPGRFRPAPPGVAFRRRPAAASAAPPGGGFGGRLQGGFPAPSEAQQVCMTFPALREDVEKSAAAIKAASERKASREEVCPLFKRFAGKEAKMIKFLETNQTALRRAAQGHHPGQDQPRQDHPASATRSAAPRPPAAAGPTLERCARRADHRRRHLRQAARARHLRHADRQRPAAMSQAAGRVADATGNWVDSSAPRWARPYLRLTRLDRPIGWWLLLLPCWWSSALAAVANGAWGPESLAYPAAADRRHRHARRRLHLERSGRSRHRRAGRAHALAADPVGAGERAGGGGVPGGAGAGRIAGAGAVQPLCHRRRHRLARRGGDLSVHEALHLLAADFPRAGVLLGRADGLGRRRAARWSGRRFCSTPARSPG